MAQGRHGGAQGEGRRLMENQFPFISTGHCRDYLLSGEGVVQLEDGRIVFVPGVFLGEEGEFEVLYSRNGALHGGLRKLLKVSPSRVKPSCPVPTACGGCSFQSLAYDEQLRVKGEFVLRELRRKLGEGPEVLPAVGMENPHGYRNKASVPVRKDRKGRASWGFFRKGTHEIVPCSSCDIEDPVLSSIIKKAGALLNELKVPPYDEKEESGAVRGMLARISRKEGKALLVLISRTRSFPGKKELVARIKREIPEVSSLVLNIQKGRTNVVLGEKEEILLGPGFIEDELLGLRFRISSKSFYQTNPWMTERLYLRAMEAAGLGEEDVVIDAYSGIGTIGLVASFYAKEVIGIEEVEEAVRDAERNREINGRENFRMILGDCPDVLTGFAREGKRCDVLFMDPPRKGSTERFLSAAKELAPRKIVYVSCNPATLARDIAFLLPEYRLQSAEPFDMFPMTPHVETLALLVRRDG